MDSSQDKTNFQKGKGKKQYQRHSAEQIKQLEVFFKEIAHPDENQRQQLGMDLGLDSKQIKFWFQNKRTHEKALHSRSDTNTLRAENEKLNFENLGMQEKLKNIISQTCSGSTSNEEEKKLSVQMLRKENEHLKEEHERAIKYFSNYMGDTPIHAIQIRPYSIMPLDHEQLPRNTINLTSLYQMSKVHEMDRPFIIRTATTALDELVQLFKLNEPIWVLSGTNGQYRIHRDSYDKLFPKSTFIKTANARTESSKDSGEVAIAAKHIVEMLLDPNNWKNMFPTIVTRANTIGILDTGSFGGSLHLMYEKMHSLSPLVAPREFFFIRYCRKIDSNSWVMVDISYNFIKELYDAAPTRSWKLPSGCMIQDQSNGKSIITWIEHVQVDDKPMTHRLYRDLILSCKAYGAKRWIASLQRTCERLAFSMGLATSPKHELEGVIDSAKGRTNLMKLSHRMVQNFSEALSMSDILDFPHLSELNNSGVRVSLRNSSGAGQPEGLVVSATASIWPPIAYESLFEFPKDEKSRARWDVLANGKPVHSIAHISTGVNLGNYISIIQPFVMKENNMLLLQESNIDHLGAMVIYAPTNLQTVSLVINGGDTKNECILPSGFVMSSDGHANKEIGAPTNTYPKESSGSLLTASFQILVCCNTLSKQLNMEHVATVHSLTSSTIQKIKDALSFSTLD